MEPTQRACDVEALVRLLADEDPRIYDACRRRLLSLGSEAVGPLRSAERLEDPRVRVRARTLLDDLRFDALEAEAVEISRPPTAGIDLERGAFLLCRALLPGFDQAPYATALDGSAAALRRRLEGLSEGRTIAQAFGHGLGAEQDYRVEEAPPERIQAGLLAGVIDRKAGTAIAVALFYLLVARRLRLPLRAVALPTGVTLRFGPPQLDLFVDPSMSGLTIDREDYAAEVEAAGFPFGPESVVELPARALLARSAAHLALALRRLGDARRARRLGRIHGILRTGAMPGARPGGGGSAASED